MYLFLSFSLTFLVQKVTGIKIAPIFWAMHRFSVCCGSDDRYEEVFFYSELQ
jgi:hypothetical protein